MGVSGIGCNPNDCYDVYSRISSGKKLQSASDGAAEMAIAEKGKAQANSYDAGTKNMESGKNVLNVMEGGLKGINDYLQRIRDLAMQAGNTAVVSDSDRRGIQKEIEQMKQGISDIAGNTQYNTKNLLDGSNDSFKMVTGPNGDGTTISAGNAALEALGIKDFDVTKNFSIKTIDNAIDMVSDQRGKAGAKSNALDFNINYNNIASQNMTGAVSRLEDQDVGEAVMELKKNQTMQTYSYLMQKKQMENEEKKLTTLYM